MSVLCGSFLVGSLFAIIMHVVGWNFQWIDIVRLAPMRIIMIVAMTCIPLVADYVVAKIRGASILARWLVLVVFGVLAAYQFGAMWLFLGALVCLDVVEGRLGWLRFSASRPVRGAATAVSWSLAVLGVVIALFAREPNWVARLQLDGIEPLSRNQWLLIFVIAAFIAIAAERRFWSIIRHVPWRRLGPGSSLAERRPKTWPSQFAAQFATSTLVVVIAVLAVDRCREFGRQTDEPRIRDLYAAQTWAREHTPEDAQFIVFDQPWRTETLRRVVIPRALMWYIYHRRPSCKTYDDGYLDFFGFDGGLAEFTMLTSYQAQKDAYLALDAGGLRRMAHRFGGDYVVRWCAEPQPDLPVAFSSEHVVIYALGERDDAASTARAAATIGANAASARR